MADTTHLAIVASDMLRQCRQTLRGMENGLSSVMKGRERDFLALGEDLMSLQAGCESISQLAHELVGCTSAQNVHAALERLSGELKTLTHLDERDAGGQSLGEIDGVGRIVEELSGILAAFSKIVKHLSMLGIATRIESARLGSDGRGFSTLADDVEKLAHLIVDHCAGIAAKIEILRGYVASARERTLGIISSQRQCYEAISGQLGANIADLRDMAACSSEASLGLSQSAEAIAADIGLAVRSLQSHDIVRQQIEHAEHALAEMGGVIDEMPAKGKMDVEQMAEMVAFVADVLTLQTSQLTSADKHFTKAADSLRGALASLAERIRDIGASIATVAGGQSGDTPLTRLESGVSTVKSKLGDFAAQGEALGDIMDSVAETISAMGGSIEAIEEVGAEIELIAINASIKAAHTGEAGAALGVLALAIQRLSADARRQTDAVTRILDEIATASTALQDNASRYNDQSDAWRVIGELDTVLAETSATSQNCQALLSRLRTASAEVGDRAIGVGRGIDFDKDIGARLTSISRTLEKLIAKAREVVPEGGKGRSHQLRQLYDRYTMEAERAVHEAAFGKALAVSQASAAASTQEPAGEFGDNVELF